MVRLNESQLRQIVKESIKKVLRESEEGLNYGNGQAPFYWSISKMKRDANGSWEVCDWVADSASFNDAKNESFETEEEAYQDGLENLRYYDKGHYMLEIYYFTQNGNGEYTGDYGAEIHNGKIEEY